MNLKKITINNYRSIEKLEIDFNGQNKSFFGFLGINEAGKSNLLKAISIKDNLSEFNYENSRRKEVEEGVIVEYEFENPFSKKDIKEILLNGQELNINKFVSEIDIKSIKIISSINQNEAPKNEVDLVLGKKSLKDWVEDSEDIVTKRNPKSDKPGLDLNQFLVSKLKSKILENAPKIIFWKNEDKYLMNGEINLSQFKSNPSDVSIPLKNCFILSGHPNIGEIIDKSNSDAAFKGDLYEEISKKITDFVNKKWADHKVELKFEESGGNLNFFVKDIDGKRQGIDSRSEGFRQFISFLLSSSAEVENEELRDSIIIIDEPESHLHPTSQEDLLKELIKISKKNIVLFATHSSYLIDKENFTNYYSVFKNDNLTNFEKFSNNLTTFSEINYIVFDIPTTDYHNELYGWCKINKETKLNGLQKKIKYIKQKRDGNTEDMKVSLPEFIRHKIHHPENKHNDSFTLIQLKESIEILRKIKYGGKNEK